MLEQQRCIVVENRSEGGCTISRPDNSGYFWTESELIDGQIIMFLQRSNSTANDAGNTVWPLKQKCDEIPLPSAWSNRVKLIDSHHKKNLQHQLKEVVGCGSSLMVYHYVAIKIHKPELEP